MTIMRSTEFNFLEQLLDRLDDPVAREEFARRMVLLHEEIRTGFSAASMLLYQELRSRAGDRVGRWLPSFYESSDLDQWFYDDPSDPSVVIGIAMKHLHEGDRKRAAHLLRRVASSGFRQRDLASECLLRHFQQN
jgi:hypothetical protein